MNRTNPFSSSLVFSFCFLTALTILGQSPPPNDDPCGAIPLVCNGPGTTQSFVDATVSSVIDGDGCTDAGDPGDLWYSFEANGASTYLVTANEVTFAIVALYRGDDCENLTEAENCNQGAKRFSGQFEAGTYYFSVRPLNLSTSNVSVQVRLACADGPPVNDDICGALPLECPDEIVHGSYLLSTNSGFDECVWSEERGDVWYSFVADGVSNYFIREFTGPSEVIQLFRAADCNDELIEVEECLVSNDFGNPEYFSAVYPAGQYYFKIRAFSVFSHTFSFLFTCNSAPPNDERCNAIPIECGENLSGTTVGASEGGDAPFCNVSNTSPGVWYKYEPLNSGNASFSLCNQANFNTRLSVYESSSCQNTLSCVAGNGNYNEGSIQCGNTSAIANAPVVAGNTYYILVHGFGASTGSFELTAICDNQLSGCTDPTAINWNPSATIDDGSCEYPPAVTCGEFLTETYCYGDNENTLFVYASESGEPMTLIFDAAVFFNGGFGFEGLRVYDGFNTNGELLFDYTDIFFDDIPSPNLAGFTYSGLSGGIAIELFSNSSGSCEDGSVPTLEWRVGCGDIDVPGCTDPEAFNYVPTANIEDGSCIFAPGNDEACEAFPLNCNANALTGALIGATVSQEVENDDCTDLSEPSEGDVWFSFEADGSSFYRVYLSGGDFVISLFKGDDCGNLTQAVPCQNFPNEYQGFFEEGTYYLSARPENNFFITDSYSAFLECSEIPENDEVCGALEAGCNAETLSQDISGSTQSIADNCGGSGTADLWYTFLADGLSTYKIAETSALDRVVSLYRASACSDQLIEIESCQDSPEFFEDTFEAGRYYFRVRPKNETGSGNLNFIELTCIEPEFCDAVSGMEVQLSTGGINFSWNSVAGTIGCQHRLRTLPAQSLVAQYFQPEFEAFHIFGPANLFDYNTEYKWEIRCACSIDPVLAGAWSSIVFSTPSAPALTSAPNPTEGLSRVSFQIYHEERVTLEVYDMTGRSLAMLYQGVASAGESYQFQFDGSSLPNGVYLYRLSTAEEVRIEKFIISK